MFGHFPDDVLRAFYEAYSEGSSNKEDLECNQPKAEVHNGKSHVVKACYPGAPEGGKLIRFGQAGVKGSPKKEGESDEYRARREAFRARHAKNIAKGKSSAAYWADRVKW